MRKTGEAVFTFSTRNDKRYYNRVSRLYGINAFAYTIDITGRLVTGQHGQIAAQFSFKHMDIAVANSSGGETNLYFALQRWINSYIFYHEGFTELITESRFHCFLLFYSILFIFLKFNFYNIAESNLLFQ